MTDKYIRKADAVDAVEFGITLASAINIETGERTELFQRENDELREAVKRIKDIEPADVVPTESQEIGYDQCANAMLKMWIDNVVTDGEYNRIMDRLNKLYFGGGERKE